MIAGTLAFYFFYNPSWDQTFQKNNIWQFFGATGELLLGQPILQYPKDANLFGGFILGIIFLLYPILGNLFIFYAIIEVAITTFEFRTRSELWFEEVAKYMNGHTIVVGIGHIGTKLVAELQAMGDNIVAITLTGKADDDFIQEFKNKGVSFIFGDGTQAHILDMANVRKASRILAVTNDDGINFKIAVQAKKLNPNIRTVLRIFDPEFSERIITLPEVDDTVSTSSIASSTFVAKAHMTGVYATLKSQVDSKMVTFLLAKVNVNKLTVFNTFGQSIQVLDIEKMRDITIMSINGHLHPKEYDIVKLYDELLILGTLDEIKKIKMDLE